ncbi:hypothetical protein GCM10010498_44130 [Streptomyces cavourensis]|nr:hypothetical protein GCM10010498_44130 [Streptomyces cavourensis]
MDGGGGPEAEGDLQQSAAVGPEVITSHGQLLARPGVLPGRRHRGAPDLYPFAAATGGATGLPSVPPLHRLASGA